MNTTFDLIIIGAGPGGYTLAALEAAKGLNVAIFERDKLGGTCLNRGCIPTKCLCATASRIADMFNADDLGVEMSFNFAALRERTNKVVTSLHDDIANALSRCTIINATAAFTPDGDVIADGITYKAARIVIATGSAPASLPIPGAELAVNSDQIFAIDTPPTSLCVIGGGVIGLELASAFADFGIQVTVVEYLPEILPAFDSDIARRLRSSLTRHDIKIITSAAAQAITSTADGLQLTYTSRGKEAAITADIVLMAVGRRPIVPDGTEAAGIALDKRGHIIVDDNLATSRPGIFALGDVTNRPPMLAHVAEAHARLLAGLPVNLDTVPSVVFTRPEAFAVGPATTAIQTPTMVKKIPVIANGYARAIGDTEGLIKITADDETRRILAIHYVGPHADTLVGEATLAVAQGITIDDLHTIIHPHPTLTELIPAALP